MTNFSIESFAPIRKNSLLGFAVVQMPSGMVLSDVSIHRQGDSIWASPASKPMVDRNGTVLKDANGKMRWQPIVSFKDKKTRDRWSAAVIEAMRAQKPEALS